MSLAAPQMSSWTPLQFTVGIPNIWKTMMERFAFGSDAMAQIMLIQGNVVRKSGHFQGRRGALQSTSLNASCRDTVQKTRPRSGHPRKRPPQMCTREGNKQLQPRCRGRSQLLQSHQPSRFLTFSRRKATNHTRKMSRRRLSRLSVDSTSPHIPPILNGGTNS